MKPPISQEFGRTLDEANLGVPTSQALLHLARRVPLPDLDIAVTAIHHPDRHRRQSRRGPGDRGGDRARAPAHPRRGQHPDRRRPHVGDHPVHLALVMFAVLQILNPVYMAALLTSGLGHMLLGLGLALQFLGGAVIWRMLRIDFLAGREKTDGTIIIVLAFIAGALLITGALSPPVVTVRDRIDT